MPTPRREFRWSIFTTRMVLPALKALLPRSIKEPLKGLRDRCRSLLRPLEQYPDAPDLFTQYRAYCRRPELLRQPGGWSYRGKFYPDYLTVGGASFAIFRVASQHCTGRGIDVGAGLWPLPGSLPVDAERGPGHGRALSEFTEASLDYVFSSHCLEHIDEWRGALARWVSKVRHGGIVFLYLPHPDCEIWHPGSPMVGDAHKWLPTPAVVTDALERLGCSVVARDDGPDAMHSFYVCARRVDGAAPRP